MDFEMTNDPLRTEPIHIFVEPHSSSEAFIHIDHPISFIHIVQPQFSSTELKDSVRNAKTQAELESGDLCAESEPPQQPKHGNLSADLYYDDSEDPDCEFPLKIMENLGRSKVKMKTETEAKRRIGKVSWGGAAADELLLIFARLPAASLARVSAVCSAWHNVVTNCSFLWEKANEQQKTELKLRFPQLSIKLSKELDFKTRVVAMRQRVHLVHGTMDSRWWKGHSSRVDCCRMSMDTVVSGSSDQIIRVWSATTLHCLEEYKVAKPKSAIVDLEFDSNKIIAATGAEVWIWNRNRGGRVTHKMGGHGCRLYCLSCTESEVAVGCADGTARIYDLYGGRCSRIFRCHSAAVSTLCMQEETQLLATGSRDGSVQVCDSSSGEIVARLLRPNPTREVECLQWGRNGHFLFAGTSVGRLCCWDIRKQEIVWQECHDKSVMKSLHVQEYAPETLVTGSMDGKVRMWDSSSGKMLRSFRPSDSSRADADGPESSWSETTVPPRGVSNSANVMVLRKQVPILCVRVGSTRVLTSHTDGTLALCQFQY